MNNIVSRDQPVNESQIIIRYAINQVFKQLNRMSSFVQRLRDKLESQLSEQNKSCTISSLFYTGSRMAI